MEPSQPEGYTFQKSEAANLRPLIEFILELCLRRAERNL